MSAFRDKLILAPELLRPGVKLVGQSALTDSLKGSIAWIFGAQDVIGLSEQPVFQGSSRGVSRPGQVIVHDAASDKTQLAANSSLISPTQNCTILMGYEKRDNVNRISGAFGNSSSVISHRLGVHLPYSDGTVYWDFGGATEGTSRLSVGGLTVTGFHNWAFTVGPRGMEIWQDGVKVASNAGNPIRNQTTNPFILGAHATTASESDLANYSYFVIVPRQLDAGFLVDQGRDSYKFLKSSGTIAPPIAAGVSSTLSGTATSSITESDIVTGGKTIILTLTGDTFVAAGTGPIGSTADTQALINGIDSAQAEATGWDAVVKAGLTPSDVVRTSDTVCTITLPAFATYDITAQETVETTIPAAVLTGASPIVAAPTFTVDYTAGGFMPHWGRVSQQSRILGAM